MPFSLFGRINSKFSVLSFGKFADMVIPGLILLIVSSLEVIMYIKVPCKKGNQVGLVGQLDHAVSGEKVINIEFPYPRFSSTIPGKP